MQGTDRLTVVSDEGADGARVLTVSGELDAHTAPDLEASLDGVSADGSLVVHLGGIEFMDSSGLRVILSANRRLTDGGGSFVLSAPSRPVQRILSVSGLDGRIAVDGTA